MSRRWSVYEKAQALRAEQQVERDKALTALLAAQSLKLEGKKYGRHEVAGEHGQHGGLDAPAAEPRQEPVASPQAVPRKQRGPQRKNQLG